MEGVSKGSKLVKEGGDGRQEGEGIVVKKQNVAMGMDVLDCPGCSTPLRPPIFQCSMGHFVCSSCRDKLPKKACSVCSWAILNRCHGMERVVDSIVVPCTYADHGCAEMISYHQKREHEEACPRAPCFCPEKGCGFAGTTEALLDHFVGTHDWPMTRFQYYMPFDIQVKAGVHVLRGSKDGHLFLLRMVWLDSPLHGVSLVRVEPHACESKSWCSVGFSWFKGHYQISMLDEIRSTSLSDGLPTDYFLTVPEACRGGGARVVMRVTIDTKGVYGDGDEPEEDNEDESYSEEEDDDNDSDDDEEDGDDDHDEEEGEEEGDNDNEDEDGEEEEGDEDEEEEEEEEEEGDDDDDDKDSWEKVSNDNDD
ncbi:E3 ubiquitin-protein ligase SINA-like 7 [Lolium perenne]|uniref:E3 ubiquitin-protein ligase SINA-like 7 n=1 Tax=Lolium perenne TaxID=4522 RepID=UPI0021EA6B64|nr:E3 ubiquitin-protein ligase SINA-like 2 [Lolium perenne]